jgi:ubiquinone/menaquinone biosynthesis C-methylase UbiE
MGVPASYILGQSTHEQERLMLQARILRPFTEKYLRLAGIGPGMRVLDLGSGMGDVALLIADLVGPAGFVLGLDRDGAALARARRRTVEQACSSWVSFEETSLADFSTSERWDAIVGRYVLMFQPDPSVLLRRLLNFLEPGGIIVFHEADLAVTHPSFPPCPLWDQIRELVPEAFRRAGTPAGVGPRLGRIYLDAGLPFPSLAADVPVGGGRGSLLYSWLAGTMFTLVPRLPELGLSLPAGVTVDSTLAARLEEAVVAQGSQIIAPAQFGAWCRKPF